MVPPSQAAQTSANVHLEHKFFPQTLQNFALLHEHKAANNIRAKSHARGSRGGGAAGAVFSRSGVQKPTSAALALVTHSYSPISS